MAYVELGWHSNAVSLLSAALGSLANGYTRDQARYAAALALAGAGEAEAAVAHAKRGAELAVATGSALAARELRRVRAALREQGAEHTVTELAAHLHALATAD